MTSKEKEEKDIAVKLESYLQNLDITPGKLLTIKQKLVFLTREFNTCAVPANNVIMYLGLYPIEWDDARTATLGMHFLYKENICFWALDTHRYMGFEDTVDILKESLKSNKE